MNYITLSNGIRMPQLGYGVYQITGDECERCVGDALKIGYRLIDTAQSYFNEEEVGNAIAKSDIPREEIFLTTKVWIEHYGYEKAKSSVLNSIQKLQVDYLDLCLLHQPFGDTYGAYRALEDLYDEGKIRAIGISNFYVDRMIDMASFNRIKPMVNQVEIHPHNQQIYAKVWHKKYNIQLEAWAPFGEGRGDMFNISELKTIAEEYGKTVAQVILRWHLQRGIVVIPKSTHIERMKENFDVFDFELSAENMSAITALDKAQSSFFSHTDPNMVEWFVNMVEQRKRQHDLCTEFPWPDDETLRVIFARGRKILQKTDNINECINIRFPTNCNETMKQYFKVEVFGNTYCDASINGDVVSHGTIECNQINGDIKECKDNINCNESINGNVKTGGNLSCGGTINGWVICGNNISCNSEINGAVGCGDNVVVGADIKGDVECGGSIECKTIEGNVECQGNIIYK